MRSLLSVLALGTAFHLAGPPTDPPRTTLSGHLTHAPAGDTVRVFYGGRRLKTVLSPSGEFQLVLQGLAAPTPVSFEYAKQRTRLYLVPGDHLRMTLDFEEFDKSLMYSGQGADVNNYLARSLYKFEYGPAGDVPRPQDQLKPATTPTELRRYVDAFRQKQLAYLAEYAQAHPLPAAFRHDAEFSINLGWATQLLTYVAYRRGQKPDEVSPPSPLPAEYFSFLTAISLQELSQHLGRSIDENTAVARFLYAYQNRLAPTGTLSPDPAAGPLLYRLATAELGDTQARDMAVQMLMFWKLDSDWSGAMAFYPTFRLHNRDSAVARNLRQSIAKMRLLGDGKPAPAFTLLDNTGKTVSLSDFKGKVVYLDFWGTWCGPCMREMTDFAPALRKQFAGRDVVFLYIAVGDPEAKWQQALANHQFTSPNSVHLRQSTAASVTTNYQVSVYPSYYLIGRDGRFIQVKPPRPSDGAATVAAIEAALKG